MSLPLFRRQRYRQIALWLALASVLLRAIIPDGFMPEHRAGRTGLVLAFCYATPLASLNAPDVQAASSAQSQPPGDHDGGGDSDHHGAAHASCVFASSLAPGLLAWVSTRVPALDALSALDIGKPVAAVIALAHNRPPTRGPPRYS
jgi:hypothetical protein